jgi:hypothetical protein
VTTPRKDSMVRCLFHALFLSCDGRTQKPWFCRPMHCIAVVVF